MKFSDRNSGRESLRAAGVTVITGSELLRETVGFIATVVLSVVANSLPNAVLWLVIGLLVALFAWAASRPGMLRWAGWVANTAYFVRLWLLVMAGVALGRDVLQGPVPELGTWVSLVIFWVAYLCFHMFERAARKYE